MRWWRLRRRCGGGRGGSGGVCTDGAADGVVSVSPLDPSAGCGMLRVMARPRKEPLTDENLDRWKEESRMGYDRHPDYVGGRVWGPGATVDQRGSEAFSRFRVACLGTVRVSNPDVEAWATDPTLTERARDTRNEIVRLGVELVDDILRHADHDWTEAENLLARLKRTSDAWREVTRVGQGRTENIRAMVAHVKRLGSAQWRVVEEERDPRILPEKRVERRHFEHVLYRTHFPPPLDKITAKEWIRMAGAMRPPILHHTVPRSAEAMWRVLHDVAVGRGITKGDDWRSTQAACAPSRRPGAAKAKARTPKTARRNQLGQGNARREGVSHDDTRSRHPRDSPLPRRPRRPPDGRAPRHEPRESPPPPRRPPRARRHPCTHPPEPPPSRGGNRAPDGRVTLPRR